MKLVAFIVCSLIFSMAHAQENVKPRVFDLYKFSYDTNFIAISPLPEKQFLPESIALLVASRVDVVITLNENAELDLYGLGNFFDVLKERGVESKHVPIADYGVPSQSQMDSIYTYIATKISLGKNILIHCKGGLGRSGTILAAFIKTYFRVENPIDTVRQIRGEAAIENHIQENFVLNYVKNF